MSDTYREQRPLLCDDCSDEDLHVQSYNYQIHNNRVSVRSGRARSYAKGAAAVITRWPDNCSTSVSYWWLGVSMIAIIIFIIYNSVLIFGMIPKTDMKLPKYRTYYNEMKLKTHTSMPEVYMHIIVNNTTDIFLNEYLSYATAVSEKYPSFKYNFVIVLNDTLKDIRDFNEGERNEIAFNSLWKDEDLKSKIYSKDNIYVEHISLTAYLNDSPIKKFWRHLPPNLIEFLVRSVSIWEKGGIAFNPKILIPNLLSNKYIDKIHEIFNNYMNLNRKLPERKISNHYAGVKTRPNNIRDIINALEKEDNISNIELSEAETNDNATVSNIGNVKFKRNTKGVSKHINSNDDFKKQIQSANYSDLNLNSVNNIISNTTNDTHEIEKVLPLFLKYLFENKPKYEVIYNISDTNNNDLSSNNFLRKNSSLYTEMVGMTQNPPLPIEELAKSSKKRDDYSGRRTSSKKQNTQKPEENISLLRINEHDNNIPELSIDTKGNIIASKIACHAFLGTMFSNVIQHAADETLTDFIISELSLFCNGLLTSCPGINVILV